MNAATLTPKPSANLGAFHLGSPASTPVTGTGCSLAITSYFVFGRIPTSYLFPYATLFRSGAPGCTALVCGTALPTTPVSADNGSVGSWVGGTSTIAGITTYRAHASTPLT